MFLLGLQKQHHFMLPCVFTQLAMPFICIAWQYSHNVNTTCQTVGGVGPSLAAKTALTHSDCGRCAVLLTPTCQWQIVNVLEVTR